MLWETIVHYMRRLTGVPSPATDHPVLNRYHSGAPNPDNLDLRLTKDEFMKMSLVKIKSAYPTDLGYEPNAITQDELPFFLNRIIDLNLRHNIFTRTEFTLGLDVYAQIFSSPGCEKLIKGTSPDMLFLVALMLAHKYSQDSPYNNHTWADMAGVYVGVVSDTEIKVLEGIGFHIHRQPRFMPQ